MFSLELSQQSQVILHPCFTPLWLGFRLGLGLGFGLGFGLGLGLVLGLGSSRDDLDDHFRRLQPIDLNLDLLGTTHLDHESRVQFHSDSRDRINKQVKNNHALSHYIAAPLTPRPYLERPPRRPYHVIQYFALVAAVG